MSHLEGKVSGMKTALNDLGLVPVVNFRDGQKEDLPIGIEVRAPVDLREGAETRTVTTVVGQIDFADKKGMPKPSWEVFYYHPEYAETIKRVVSSFREAHIPLVERQSYRYQQPES